MIRALMLGVLVMVPLETAAASDRVLRAEITVPAPIEEVWKAWTTAEGIATFFAPVGKVDLRIDGTYDVWFDPKANPDLRGAEGMRIVGLEPNKRFAFTWNGPPSIPAIRVQRTIVVLDFAAAGERATRLRFTEMGWGDGPEWDTAYDYFDKAWGAVVLPRLIHRFEKGPIDWKAPPKLESIGSMVATLEASR